MHRLDAAINATTVDINARMKEIKHQLDEHPTSQSTAEKDNITHSAALLDELMEIVEQIDHARDLQTIGGLPTLMALLGDPAPVLRAKAAEVVATCAQNNPPVQAVRAVGFHSTTNRFHLLIETHSAPVVFVRIPLCVVFLRFSHTAWSQWMLQGGAMPKLFVLLHDDDERCRVKALLALSCMVRGDASALAAFRAQHGVAALVGLLAPDAQPPRVQRYVYNKHR